MSRRPRLPYAFLIKSSQNIFSGSGSSSLKAKLEDSSKLATILAYPFSQCLPELARGDGEALELHLDFRQRLEGRRSHRCSSL